MKLPRSKLVLAGIGLVIFIAFVGIVVAVVPAGLGIDWRLTYRPATLAFLHGQNPFNVEISPTAPFFAAPWGLLPFIPMAFLPVEIGRAMIMVIGIFAFAFAAYRMGAKPIAMAAFLLSPPVVHSILNANLEWLPILGFVMPPPIGLFFVTVKPQTGFAVAIFWFVEAWRTGGVKAVIRTFAPVTIAYGISFLFYGFWPMGMFTALHYGANYNSSLWPASIPVGLVLLVTSFQRRNIKYAMPASPCLSPYVIFHAWSSAVIALVNDPLQLITAVLGLWLVVGIRIFAG